MRTAHSLMSRHSHTHEYPHSVCTLHCEGTIGGPRTIERASSGPSRLMFTPQACLRQRGHRWRPRRCTGGRPRLGNSRLGFLPDVLTPGRGGVPEADTRLTHSYVTASHNDGLDLRQRHVKMRSILWRLPSSPRPAPLRSLAPSGLRVRSTKYEYMLLRAGGVSKGPKSWRAKYEVLGNTTLE